MQFPGMVSGPRAWTTSAWKALCLVGLLVGSAAEAAGLPRDESALTRLASGVTNSANAIWWGFDASDATEAVQSAIDSGAPRVVIPFVGAPWVLKPIHLRGNLDLVLEPGVVVLAKPGEFRGGGDSLFSAVEQTNITLRGNGAVLRMRKSDYQNPPYTKAEWRMGLSFAGCRDVVVEGLRIESSGGDGIYIGSTARVRWCENVTVRNCACYNHHRQGISIISAVNLLVENCTFSGTDGTVPEAGIDLEPDVASERLVRCVFRNCVVSDNTGNGILVYLKPLDRSSEPVSIRFEDCHVRMGPPAATPGSLGDLGDRGWSGIAVGEISDEGPGGLVEFIRCTSENTGREAVRLMNKSARGAHVRFVDCWWKSTWLARHRDYGGPRSPVLIRSSAPDRCRVSGGMEWVDCRLDDTVDAPVVRFEDDDGRGTLADVSGRIQVLGPVMPRVMLGASLTNVTLRVTR